MEQGANIDSQNMLPTGTMLQGGKYTISKTLGQGSFGITYLAKTLVKIKAEISGSLGQLVQDQEVEVKVCIKEFFMKEVNNRGGNGSSVEGTTNTLYTNYRKRFRKEAENLSQLKHPNIVKVLEVFDENGTTYYVMQFIEGETLDDYIKRQRLGYLEEDEAKGVILTLAKALQYMHEKWMLHLDLKPKNIMRGTDGTEHIIDFGLSKQYDEKGEPESSTAIGLGTPGYAPTEQADHIPDGTFPATIDIYALGATLFKMLTGKTPPSANEVLNYGLTARPAHVSSSMWGVVEHAMQPRKKDRPQNIVEFLKILNTDNTEMTQAIPEKDDYTEATTIEPEPVHQPVPVSAGKTVTCNATLKKRQAQQPVVQQPTTTTTTTPTSSSSTQTITANGVSFKIIRVEGGTFTMGATSEQGSYAYDGEKPAHQVTLSSYYIGETEVTQALWEAVMGSNPSKFKGANRPVENVSWDDCQTFINKLNAITGKNFRLPTEAEWEYAARGGSKSNGYKFSGNKTLDEVGWYDSNSGNETHNVKTQFPNELGIYDMSGNVWEWCQDWYGDNYYASSPQSNPKGPSAGSTRVGRGGGWSSSTGYCRVSFRSYGTPDCRGGSLGLRLAL